jgi:hypothetical protein
MAADSAGAEVSFVLDGSNLARMLPGSCMLAIDRVAAALAALHPESTCAVLCDPSLRRQIGAVDRAEFERRLCLGHWQETPPGIAADLAILAHARRLGAIVVSRDRFRDHPDARRDVPVLAVHAGASGIAFGPALVHGSDGTLRRIDVEQHLRVRALRRS